MIINDKAMAQYIRTMSTYTNSERETLYTGIATLTAMIEDKKELITFLKSLAEEYEKVYT